MQFVLIHGGWQGGWCWDGVADELRRKGHDVFAPTMRGSESGQADRSGVTLSNMADRVARDLADRDLHDVVAVGHSGGGPVIQLLHEADPTRFERLIFIDAWVLNDGQSIYDVLNAGNRSVACRPQPIRRSDRKSRCQGNSGLER